jgi:tetratricopeptide (TPR) repeat protein
MASTERSRGGKGRDIVLLDDVRTLGDEELCARLRAMGIDLTKDELGHMARTARSAEELANRYHEKLDIKGDDADWLWFCLTILWERWCPDIPHLESLDACMQKGYEYAKKLQEKEAVSVWQSYWQDVKWMMQRWEIPTVRAFDKHLMQSQYLFNWIQDFDMALDNASRADQSINETRLRFCTEVIPLFDPGKDLNSIQNMRRAIAESHFNMGRIEEADKIFEQGLEEDPGWTWGWIGWADCYAFSRNSESADLPKAVRLLNRCLEIGSAEDTEKQAILDRLADIYTQMGKSERAAECRRRLSALTRQPTPPPRAAARVGRNQPCPCGSGTKYKRCCGKKRW